MSSWPDAVVTVHYEPGALDMELGLKSLSKAAFNISSYAVTGAVLGSGFPVIGTAIGAAIGAAFGMAISTLDLFLGKDTR